MTTRRGRPEVGMLMIELDAELPAPLYQQLAGGLRRAILQGRLRPEQRLPSSRLLAEELHVARGTVVLALEQLQLEGYVTARVGAGTFVEALPPEYFLRADAAAEGEGAGHAGRPPEPEAVRPFMPGTAPLDQFPRDLLARLAARSIRGLSQTAYSYSTAAGYPPLRRAVAAYLRTGRGVRCRPEQVIVTGGSQQALFLAAAVLRRQGACVWVEDPGYGGIRRALAAVGAERVPVPVDDEGLSVQAGRERGPDACAAYVTPSNQYPLGITMSLHRRLELLAWAREADAYVLEDDYDSEYRYEGQPLPSLQGLDEHDRVVYVGSFSKVLAPGLRLGYVVPPRPLLDAFLEAKAAVDTHSPVVMQATLAAFIDEGHFGRHLRRMRVVGARRRAALAAMLDEAFGGRLRPVASRAGLHLTAFLPVGVDDAICAERAEAAGVTVRPLSAYADANDVPPGLVFGYASYPESEMRRAVARLREALDGVV